MLLFNVGEALSSWGRIPLLCFLMMCFLFCEVPVCVSCPFFSWIIILFCTL